MSVRLSAGGRSIDIPDPPGGVRTDMSHWPLAVVTPPTTAMSDADYRAYLEWTRRYVVCTGQGYALVLDAQNTPGVSASQRQILGEHMQSTKAFSSKYCAGTAMVFDSTLMRGMMTAIFWLSQPQHATKVFSQKPDAIFWAKSRLETFTAGSNAARPNAGQG